MVKMRIPKAFPVAFFLMFFSSAAFSLACSGVSDFEAQYSQAQGLSAGSQAAIDSFQEIKSGTIMEFSNNQIGKLVQTAPVALSLETGSKAKIYYALATKTEYFSAEKYGSLSLFNWTDAQGTNILDGIQAGAKPENCAKWKNAQDAAMLDLSNYPPEQAIKLFTATAMPSGTYFALLCATADVSLTVTKADKSGIKYSLGKGVFNGGTTQMIPLNEAQEAESQTFIGNVKEQVKAGNACIEGNKIKWNLAGMLEVSVKGLAQTPAEIVLEPDKDGDKMPDSTDPEPETQQKPSAGQSYPELAQDSEYTLLFMPLQWDHSLDSSLGTFEQNINNVYDYFLEKSGLGSCGKKVSKIVLSESDVKGCGLESIDVSCFAAPRDFDIISNCASKKAGLTPNLKTAFVALANRQIGTKEADGTCDIVDGYSNPNRNDILLGMGTPEASFSHELGHLFFSFCDQYSVEAFSMCATQMRAAGKPAGQQKKGSQNKYPGPGGEIRYKAQYSYTEILVQYNPDLGNCPTYDKCSYETGKLVTCCPNRDSEYLDCTGRFIPFKSGSRTVVGASIMGPAMIINGRKGLIPRDFDCFEQEAIKAITGC
ncbi:MAG: hypothetical protein NT067_00380 [Candidatus Diapherotrites archaeon]|nr:hypothetical protein [Candidatus Diapherotrites archaeon]